MGEGISLAIDKVCEEFRPRKGDMMVMMSMKEYQGLVRLIATKGVEYGWYEGMDDAKYVKELTRSLR